MNRGLSGAQETIRTAVRRSCPQVPLNHFHGVGLTFATSPLSHNAFGHGRIKLGTRPLADGARQFVAPGKFPWHTRRRPSLPLLPRIKLQRAMAPFCRILQTALTSYIIYCQAYMVEWVGLAMPLDVAELCICSFNGKTIAWTRAPGGAQCSNRTCHCDPRRAVFAGR